MGHCIRAIIGTHKVIQELENNWGNAKEIELPQGYGMVFLTDEFSDDVTELYGISDELYCHELVHFTAAIAQLLQQYTHNTKLAYVETDYFGAPERREAYFMKTDKSVLYHVAEREQSTFCCGDLVSDVNQIRTNLTAWI